MMKKLSLNLKFVMVLAVFIAGSVTISFFGLSKMGTINDILTEFTKVLTVRRGVSADVQDIMRQVTIAEKDLLLEKTREARLKRIKLGEELAKQFDVKIGELEKIISDEKKGDIEKIQERFESWRKINSRVQEFAREGKFNEAYALSTGVGREHRHDIEERLTEIGDYNRKVMDEKNDRADVIYANSKRLVLLVSIFANVLGVVFAFIVLRALSKAINRIIKELNDSSGQVKTASEQLSGASQQLSAASTESAASLEETVSSLEELSSMVKLNADNAKEASALSAKGRSAAEEGETEIQKLIAAMNEIAQSSKKIEEIITVIDDIAFQTNLLALNAAVEAARAGEQGKGFAVVAEAVRNLAQRSASAAKDISGLIKDSVSKIENGTEIADESGTVLKNIVSSVKKVADLNNEIASASQEQSSGITQISKAMNQLDQTTQSNAASAEEAAASSEELSAQATSLQGTVHDLTRVVHGTADRDTDLDDHPAQQQPRTTAKPAVKKPKAPVHVAQAHPQAQPKARKQAASAERPENVIPLENGDARHADSLDDVSGF